MPTYTNNKSGLLFIEGRHRSEAGLAEMREIPAKATFAAHSSEIPARWLSQGNPLEGAEPWVTLVHPSPTDEELSG